MAKQGRSISMEESVIARIEKLAEEQERTFSWIGEKLLIRGLDALDAEEAEKAEAEKKK